MASRRGARSARISVGGTSEIAGALLAASLQGEGVGVVSPAEGASFRWTKAIDDPVVVDALAAVREICGIEPDLVVLDVRAVAAAEWTSDRIDAMLGAAGTADLGAVEALSSNFAAGVVPEVHRPLAAMGAATNVAWIVPYSPFSGGWDATRDLVGVPRRVWPVAQLRAEDARRFVAARQIGLAVAPALLPESACLPEDDGPTAAWRTHLAEVLADLVGCAVLRHLGSDEAADLIPQLREARAGLRLRDGRLAREDLILDTAGALRAAADGWRSCDLPAVAAAFANPQECFLPPAASVGSERIAALEDAAATTACDHDLLPDELRQIAAEMLAADLADVVATLPDDPRARERFACYGAWRTPLGLQEIFRDYADRLRPEASAADAYRPLSQPAFSLTF